MEQCPHSALGPHIAGQGDAHSDRGSQELRPVQSIRLAHPLLEMGEEIALSLKLFSTSQAQTVTCCFRLNAPAISLHCAKPPSSLPSARVVLCLTACCLESGGVTPF